MVSDELKIIIENLNKKGEMSFLEGATKEQIDSFEKKHDIELPSEYREWLLFSDGGEFYTPVGFQLYGVAHKPVLDTEYDDRPNNNYIVIGALPSGDPVLCEKTKEQISIYNHEEGIIEEDETYTGFFSFLSDLSNILGIEG